MSRVLSALALLVVVAGCGGAARPQRTATHQVPPALARSWEGQSEAIATAASAGDDCHALQLAVSLRNDVEKSEHELPLRLRSPLLAGVNALAARAHIECTPPATSVPQQPSKPPKPPHDKHGDHEHHHHGHQGHGKGDGGGDG